MAERHLGVKTILYTDVAGKGAKQIGFEEVALEQAEPYAAEDAEVCLRLHQHLHPQLESTGALAAVLHDIEMPLLPVPVTLPSVVFIRRVSKNTIFVLNTISSAMPPALVCRAW